MESSGFNHAAFDRWLLALFKTRAAAFRRLQASARGFRRNFLPPETVSSIAVYTFQELPD
jgi:hypothetical protein